MVLCSNVGSSHPLLCWWSWAVCCLGIHWGCSATGSGKGSGKSLLAKIFYEWTMGRNVLLWAFKKLLCQAQASAMSLLGFIVQVFGAPVAYILLQTDGVFGLRGWQWLFIMVRKILLSMSPLWNICNTEPCSRCMPWFCKRILNSIQNKEACCRKGCQPSSWAFGYGQH